MMTERPNIIPTPNATSQHHTFQSPLHIITRDDTQDADGEDEPFTIKCICGFDDDDGNTVYCESCDTWQHIICFYPNDTKAASKDDFDHKCHECNPRQDKLNPYEARRTQTLQRAEAQRKIDSDLDRKPAKKSHKKKPPSDLIVNIHDQDRSITQKKGSPADRPIAQRKPKAPHRSRPSISSHTSKRSPSHNHVLTPSPPSEITDNSQLYEPSPQVRALYDYDSDVKKASDNTFASLDVISSMSHWVQDEDHLRRTIQTDIDGIFNRFNNNFNFASYRWPSLKIRSEKVGTKEPLLHVQYLESVAAHPPSLLCELHGSVGFQQELCAVESDFFTRLSHPPPFVFFHSALPLYIDTRQEGSLCRYTRRSCNPNCAIDIYLTNQSEYHFILVNETAIPERTQLTIAWDFYFPSAVRKHYINLLVPDRTDPNVTAATHITKEEYDYLSWYIRELLSEFGGCACGLGSDCSFVRFHRNHQGKFEQQYSSTKAKKGRKPKNQVSPIGAGHGSNTRDPSEVNNNEDDEQDDTRSTSGSAPSKHQSREISPAIIDPILDSERERRKIEAIERQFTNQEPTKKKKRPSEMTATVGTPQPQLKRQRTTIKSQPAVTSASNSVRRKDSIVNRPPKPAAANSTTAEAVTPPSQAHSAAPSPKEQHRRMSTTRPVYVNASMQTDASMDPDSWYSPPKRPIPKKRVISLESRLYSAYLKKQHDREERRKQEADARKAMPTAMDAQIAQIEGRSSVNNLIERLSAYHPSLPTSVMQHQAGNVSAPETELFPIENTKQDQTCTTSAVVSKGIGRNTLEFRVPMPTAPSFSSVKGGFVMMPSSADSLLTHTPPGSSNSLSQATRLSAPPSIASPGKKTMSFNEYITKQRKKPSVTTPLSTDNSNMMDEVMVNDESNSNIAGNASLNGRLDSAEATVDILGKIPTEKASTSVQARTPLPSL